MRLKRRSDGALRFWMCLLIGEVLILVDALPELSFGGLTVLGILAMAAGCIPEKV